MSVENKPEQGIIRRLVGLLPPIRERREYNGAAQVFLAALEPFSGNIDKLQNHEVLELPIKWPQNASEWREVKVHKVNMGFEVKIFRTSNHSSGRIGVYTASYPPEVQGMYESEEAGDSRKGHLVKNLSRKTEILREVTQLLTGTRATDNLPHG